MLYKEWLDEWLEEYIKIAVKERTYQKYRDIVKQRLIPTLGECEISQITPLIIQRYIAELLKNGNMKTGKGLSANSVNLVIAVLKSSLETARNSGLAGDTRLTQIKRPRISEKQIGCFSLSEQRCIEHAIVLDKRPKMLGVMICLYTGIRIGELLALEWSDLDFEKKEIKISKTCYESNGARIVSTPKTVSSVRTIPLPEQLIRLMQKRATSDRQGFVISENGKGVSVRSYQRSFELLLKKLEIPHRGFHALRHTFATRALEYGMDVKTLSEILGHKNPTVTLTRYAHSLEDHKRSMMNLLGSALNDAI